MAPGVATRSPYLKSLTLGNGNVNGQGIFAEAQWRDGGVYRDTWRAQVIDYQVFDRPIQFELLGARRDLGSEWSAELAYPFLTDVQRSGWNAGSQSHDFAPFLRPEGDPRPFASTVPTRRWAGPSLRASRAPCCCSARRSGEKAESDNVPVALTSEGCAPTRRRLLNRYSSQRSVRLNALLGLRNINFMRVEAFDALTAEQDVRHGVQLGMMIGRGTAGARLARRRHLRRGELYACTGTPNSFVAVEALADTRSRDADDEWDAVLMSGVSPGTCGRIRAHAVTSGEWSAGWRQREPFQLSLGDRRGVRATKRVGVRSEEGGVRWRPLARRHVRGSADAASPSPRRRLDARRRAPFGVDTRMATSLGIGLLAAVPPPRSESGAWISPSRSPRSAIPAGACDSRTPTPRAVLAGAARRAAIARSAVPASVFAWP